MAWPVIIPKVCDREFHIDGGNEGVLLQLPLCLLQGDSAGQQQVNCLQE